MPCLVIQYKLVATLTLVSLVVDWLIAMWSACVNTVFVGKT